MEYYAIGQFAKEIGVTVQSVRNWDKSDKLNPHHISDGSHRYYSQEQVNLYLGLHKPTSIQKKIIGYCRVSSQKQKDDLEKQELVEDLIQIVTVFSCRLQGKRANKAKRMIKELVESDSG